MILYLYTLQGGMGGLTSAVLLFNAFTCWPGNPAEESSEEAKAKTLTRFYSYAIRSFISLL
jgi:hypothetical protein